MRPLAALIHVRSARGAARVAHDLIKLPTTDYVAWRAVPGARGGLGGVAGWGEFGGLFVEAGLLDRRAEMGRYFEDYECMKVFGGREGLRLLNAGGVRVRGVFGDVVDMAALGGVEAPAVCAEGSSVEGAVEDAVEDARRIYEACGGLTERLKGMGIRGCHVSPEGTKYRNLFELYIMFYLPFQIALTGMEHSGLRVDPDKLQSAARLAEMECEVFGDAFRRHMELRSPDARYMDLDCDRQLRHLLHAPCSNVKAASKAKPLPEKKTFSMQLTGPTKERYLVDQRNRASEQGGGARKSRRRKTKSVDEAVDAAIKAKVTLTGLGLPAQEHDAKGWPSVSTQALQKLAGAPYASLPVYGIPNDPDLCVAVSDVAAARAISALNTNFIAPLLEDAGENGCIFPSFSVDSVSGRLVANRPNLRHMPRMGQDRYDVLDAFACEPGNRLIVADYEDLDLRMLAHLANCESMLDAFRAGGDFHSRTAVSMFESVNHSVQNGDCLVEYVDEDEPDSTQPLLQDRFPAEYRVAKAVNVAISQYGSKTASELARVMQIDSEMASKAMKLWQEKRPEVAEWQQESLAFARENDFVETMMGRRRAIIGLGSRKKLTREAAERAAVTFPLQGSVGEVEMAAITKLQNNETLKALGWKTKLHAVDEFILEGPLFSTDAAMPVIVENMKDPLSFALRVELQVDALCGSSWHTARSDLESDGTVDVELGTSSLPLG